MRLAATFHVPFPRVVFAQPYRVPREILFDRVHLLLPHSVDPTKQTGIEFSSIDADHLACIYLYNIYAVLRYHS